MLDICLGVCVYNADHWGASQLVNNVVTVMENSTNLSIEVQSQHQMMDME